MKATILLRSEPHYRSEAFRAGLRSLGYTVGTNPDPTPDDVLVLWNRNPRDEREAMRFDAVGATVIIAENGYCGRDEKGRQYYAMALDGHNGSGRWFIGEERRFDRLGITPAPFTRRSGPLLICGQRGIGSRVMASPTNWHVKMAESLQKRGFTVKVRTHPGNRPPAVPLAEDLATARACVIWSSACGVQALLAGVPVVYAAPTWICRDAACRVTDESLVYLMREEERRDVALHRMSWAQWSVAEIESGEPFRRLLAL